MKKKLTEYLLNLVNIPSVIGNEKEIADFVENFSKRYYPEKKKYHKIQQLADSF